MTAETRFFEYHDDRSSRFWEVAREGGTVTVRFGKTGTAGQTQERAFTSATLAATHVDKLVREKTTKGYQERAATPIRASSSAEAYEDKTSAANAPPAKAAKPKSPLQDPDASPESLLSLLDRDDANNRLLAKHPNATADLLEKLSHSSDRATRQAVTGNANTPLEAYVRLGQQFPKEFLANPALDVLLMVNPALMDQVPEALLIRLLKQTGCPPSLLAWAAGHESAKVQLVVAMNAHTPDLTLQRLRQSEHSVVRESVLTRSGAGQDEDPEAAFEQAVRDRLASMTPEELSEAWRSGDIGLVQWSALPLTFRLAKATDDYRLSPSAIANILSKTSRTVDSSRKALPNYEYWREVAANPSVPASALELLARDSDSIREGVARNPSTPVAVLEALAKDASNEVREQVARHPATPPHVLETLAKDPERRVLSAIASNPHTPTETFQGLAKKSFLRGQVAGNPSTPNPVRQSLLEDLASSPQEHVRASVAASVLAPASVLVALAKDRSRTVRERLARNPMISEDALEVLAADREREIRGLAASNPAASVALLRVLSRDTEYAVRRHVASAKATPSSLLEELAGDQSAWVKMGVAASPNTPLSVLQALSEDSDATVRREVANNACASAKLLAKLSKDPDNEVRAHVARHLTTPPEALQQLAADRVGEVASQAVRNPNTPLPALIAQVAANTVSVRLALACQGHRSPEIRRALWKDRNADVRLAVTECPELTGEMLDEMARSTELESDLVRLLEHPNLEARSVEFVADKLFNTPAIGSAWYRRELSSASGEVRTAAQGSDLLFHHGKDPNKAVLSKRAIGQVMAICAGPFIEPARLVRVVGSADWLVRAAVARNPGTPPNLLEKLNADPHPLVAALARKARAALPAPAAPKDDVRTARFDFGRAVAEARERLARACADNPGLLISVVTDPTWGDLTSLGEVMIALHSLGLLGEVLEAICSNLGEDQLTLLWEMGAKADDARVRRRLAESSVCPPDVLGLLGRDGNLEVAVTAMANPAFPRKDKPTVIQGLIKLRGSRLLELVRHPHAPTEVLEEKGKDRDRQVRGFVGANSSTPDAVLMALSKDPDEWVRREVALNTATPAVALEALAKDSEGDVRENIASNPSTPGNVLDRLSRKASGEVRSSLVSNPSTPFSARLDLLEKMAKDRESRYRNIAAASPLALGQVLEGLSKDSDALVRSRVASNPSASVSMLADLSRDLERSVRVAVSGNPNTSSAVLEALSADVDQQVRRRIAGNPSAPLPVLAALALDSSAEIRSEIAKNPSSPLPVLEALARDPEVVVRMGVARNPAITVAMLVVLAEDDAWQVQRAIASNQAVPMVLRDRSIQWWGSLLRRALQRASPIREAEAPAPKDPVSRRDLLRALEWLNYVSSDADNKALTKASRSTDWLIRLGAALHPAATEGILKILRQDCDPDVVRAAMS